MSNPMPNAGWYPDPEGGHRLRWWDGTEWSQHYCERPVESFGAPDGRPTTPSVNAETDQASGLANDGRRRQPPGAASNNAFPGASGSVRPPTFPAADPSARSGVVSSQFVGGSAPHHQRADSDVGWADPHRVASGPQMPTTRSPLKPAVYGRRIVGIVMFLYFTYHAFSGVFD